MTGRYGQVPADRQDVCERKQGGQRRFLLSFAPLLSLILTVLTLAGCAGGAATRPGAAAAAGDPRLITAVLVAGDGSLPVFDNSIEHFRDLLKEAGVPDGQIHLLSAREALPPGMREATLSNVEEAVDSVDPAPGGSCLVYMTSHGAYQKGLYLSRSDDVLTPDELAAALKGGCGDVPTVVILSACYSGQFLTPAMEQPNRIVMTASREDRTSFGCDASFFYTYYDECLLGSLAETGSWQEIGARAMACVAERERKIGAQPSEPQAFFGKDAAALPPPWRLPPHAIVPAIRFAPTVAPFDVDLVPIPANQRRALRDMLKRYAAAPAPKALALTPGGFLLPVTSSEDDRLTADDAARLAIQRCEWLTGNACILYARDNAVVDLLPSGLAPFHPSRLVREGRLDAATTPFIRDDQRPEITKYLAETGERALALSAGHTGFFIGHGETVEAARRSALAQCRTTLFDCVVYAEDDKVVLGWGD